MDEKYRKMMPAYADWKPVTDFGKLWLADRARGGKADSVGYLAIRAVAQVGTEYSDLEGDEIRRAGLDAACYTAAVIRGDMEPGTGITRADFARIASLIAGWSRAGDTRYSPFEVDYREGTDAQVADEAARLSLVATTLDDLMRSENFTRRPGDLIYQRAAENHAYAAVATDPDVLDRLTASDAECVAENAAHRASLTIMEPEVADGPDAVSVSQAKDAARLVYDAVGAWRRRAALDAATKKAEAANIPALSPAIRSGGFKAALKAARERVDTLAGHMRPAF